MDSAPERRFGQRQATPFPWKTLAVEVSPQLFRLLVSYDHLPHADTPKDDEAKFNETLKRLLKTPPKPHKPLSKKDSQ
jgi:hypothetical protein